MLVKKCAVWTSHVYEHFKPAVIACDEKVQKLYHKGTLLYSFVCKQYVLDTIHVTHVTNLVILYSTGAQVGCRNGMTHQPATSANILLTVNPHRKSPRSWRSLLQDVFIGMKVCIGTSCVGWSARTGHTPLSMMRSSTRSFPCSMPRQRSHV